MRCPDGWMNSMLTFHGDEIKKRKKNKKPHRKRRERERERERERKLGG